MSACTSGNRRAIVNCTAPFRAEVTPARIGEIHGLDAPSSQRVPNCQSNCMPRSVRGRFRRDFFHEVAHPIESESCLRVVLGALSTYFGLAPR